MPVNKVTFEEKEAIIFIFYSFKLVLLHKTPLKSFRLRFLKLQSYKIFMTFTSILLNFLLNG